MKKKKKKKQIRELQSKLGHVIAHLKILQEDFDEYKKLNPGKENVFEHSIVYQSSFYVAEDRQGVGHICDYDTMDSYENDMNCPYQVVGQVFGIPSTGVSVHSENRVLVGHHVYVHNSNPSRYIQIVSINREVEEWNAKQVDG